MPYKSLFLRYKKISKKAVQLGSFLQCSVYIFLGHDGRFSKISLRILWNYITKNFQIKHGQCDSIIFPKTFSFDSRILYFWQVLKSIHKFTIELHVLQRLFVRGSGETFHVLWQPSALVGDLRMCSSFLHPPKNTFLSHSLWPRREHTWILNWKESLLICSENCRGVLYSYSQSRNRMRNTFIILIINISLTC